MSHPSGVKWWQELVQGLLYWWHLVKLCTVLHAHQSCQGSFLSCSERAESELYPSYQRMLSGRAVCLSAAHAARCGVGRAPCVCRRRKGHAAGSFSQVFPACALQAAGASQHRELSGPLRIPDLCPVHWSAAAAPCQSLGVSGKCLVCVSHERREPRAG